MIASASSDGRDIVHCSESLRWARAVAQYLLDRLDMFLRQAEHGGPNLVGTTARRTLGVLQHVERKPHSAPMLNLPVKAAAPSLICDSNIGMRS